MPSCFLARLVFPGGSSRCTHRGTSITRSIPGRCRGRLRLLLHSGRLRRRRAGNPRGRHHGPAPGACELFFQLQDAFNQGFRPWRTTGNEHIHGEKLAYALHHAVLPFVHKRPAGNGAIAHGDDPLWLGHLVVKNLHSRGHLLVDGAGNDHHIALPGRRPEHLGPKARQIKAGRAGRHHFNGAAGKAECHGPERIGPAHVQQRIQPGKVDYRSEYIFRCHWNTPFFHAYRMTRDKMPTNRKTSANVKKSPMGEALL